MKKVLLLIAFIIVSCKNDEINRPNILFIMSDDHTSQSWGIYGGILKDYVKNDVAIPEKYAEVCKPVHRVKEMKGEKHCELRLGMTKELEPCKFFADNVWWRGVIDLLIVNGDKGKIIDYKTGKNSKYADIKQLDLFTVAAFTHFPDLTEIKAGLLFLVTNDFITKSYNK